MVGERHFCFAKFTVLVHLCRGFVHLGLHLKHLSCSKIVFRMRYGAPQSRHPRKGKEGPVHNLSRSMCQPLLFRVTRRRHRVRGYGRSEYRAFPTTALPSAIGDYRGRQGTNQLSPRIQPHHQVQSMLGHDRYHIGSQCS